MKVVSIGGKDSRKFDDLVAEEQSFVKFYHPSCGHCVAMAPEWKKLEHKMRNKDHNLNIIEVHADAIPNIKSKCASSVQGYPTIMEVKPGGLNGKEYNGSRDSNEMVKFIIEELINDNKPVIKRKKRHSRKKHSRKRHRRGKHSQRAGTGKTSGEEKSQDYKDSRSGGKKIRRRRGKRTRRR